jgi:uncharacterized membrane protein
MKDRDQNELNVISDIRSIAVRGDVLVEAVGDSYLEYSRISESTGVPAVLGWEFHERQWHGTDELFSGRSEDVKSIYTADDEQDLAQLIDKYDLTMVVVGPRERSTYGNIDMAIFDTLGDRIIEHGDYTVFSIDK